MDRKTLSRRIIGIAEDMGRIQQDAIQLEKIDIVSNPTQYTQLTMDIAYKSEVVVERIRRLVVATTNEGRGSYAQNVAEHLGISVKGSVDEVVEITMPCLLPTRKKPNTNFLLDPLNVELGMFVLNNRFARFKDCVICFVHIYDKSTPERKIRDHDNIEVRDIMNVINAHLLTDDSGLYCDNFSSTELGEENCTRIYVMAKDKFPDWVLRHKKAL